MFDLREPLVTALPSPEAVRDRLGDVLQEAEMLRRLLPIAERAAGYRRANRAAAGRSRSAVRRAFVPLTPESEPTP